MICIVCVVNVLGVGKFCERLVFSKELLVNIVCSESMWFDVLLYCSDFCFEVLVLIMLLSVVWLLVERFGEKKKLCGCIVLLSWFLMIFVCICIYFFCGLIFRIWFICCDKLMIIFLVSDWLFVFVLLLWGEKVIFLNFGFELIFFIRIILVVDLGCMIVWGNCW